ncbi:MAG: YwbE family protein, partial [Methanobacterium sp.]
MNGKNRKDISPGMEVYIILKKDQHSGRKTRGFVKNILTNSSFHPHG